MDIRKNAKLTPQKSRRARPAGAHRGATPAAVTTAAGVCSRTMRKWVAASQRLSGALE